MFLYQIHTTMSFPPSTFVSVITSKAAHLISLAAVCASFLREWPVAVCSFSLGLLISSYCSSALTFKETRPWPYVLQIFFQIFFIAGF